CVYSRMCVMVFFIFFFFSSRRRHTSFSRDWSSDVCSSDLRRCRDGCRPRCGSYMRPSEDGTRPGIFYVNTYDLPTRKTWDAEDLFLHEAIPGHHFQIALQQELTGLPAFRRFGGQTAFIEGWGLYAESLGRDLGLYTDPYSYFGYLQNELWRAIRLVVDTGLHSKG